MKPKARETGDPGHPVSGRPQEIANAMAGDISIHIVEGDHVHGFVPPGGKKLGIAGVVDVGSGLCALAAQPLGEALDLWKHATPPGGRMMVILPPGVRCENCDAVICGQ